MSQRNHIMTSVSSPQALTLMINTYYHVCRISHRRAWIFTFQMGFCLLKWLDRIFSSLGFYFFRKPGLIGFFSSWRFYFSAKPTWSSNHGGEWHRPRISRAWNRWSGPGIEPWTHKKIMLKGQGIKPWTNKNDHVQGQGFKPWTDQKDHSYNCARDC